MPARNQDERTDTHKTKGNGKHCSSQRPTVVKHYNNSWVIRVLVFGVFCLFLVFANTAPRQLYIHSRFPETPLSVLQQEPKPKIHVQLPSCRGWHFLVPCGTPTHCCIKSGIQFGLTTGSSWWPLADVTLIVLGQCPQPFLTYTRFLVG